LQQQSLTQQTNKPVYNCFGRVQKMNLEVDFTAIYYFLWSLCMLVSMVGLTQVFSEHTNELKSTVASLNDARRDMNAIAYTFKRTDQAKVAMQPV